MQPLGEVPLKLETRLLLAVGAVLLVVFAADGLVTYRQLRQHALLDLELQAEKVQGMVMATRRVYQRALLANDIPVEERTLPLLPAHAMRRISEEFGNWDGSGLTFNNVSDRPRNPVNRADAVEMAAIERFRAEPQREKLLVPFTDDNGAPWLLYARPILVEEYCLTCHGDPADAPAVIREKYAEGFGYRLGELRGILSIKLPARHVAETALAALPARLGADLAGLIIIFLAVGFVIRRYVRRPLERLDAGMRAVAAGDYAQRVEGVDGEFARVAEAFNAMAEQIPLHHAEIRRLSQAVEQSPASVMITDLDGRIVYVNRRFTELTGYGAHEAVGRLPSLLKSGMMPETVYRELWRTLADGGEWRGELLNRKKNGELYWETASISPVRGVDGEVSHYMAVKEDVTERKQAQQAVRESNERLRLLLDATGEGIFGVDAASRCTFINPAALRLLGYDRAEELLGRDLHALIHHHHPDGTPLPASDCRILAAIQRGIPAHADDEAFWRKDGSSAPVEYRAHPIMLDGRVIGGVVSFTDITDRRSTEETMRQMVDQLVRSNTELERFAYVASHDLQEPLRSVASYAQLIARRYRGKLDPDADVFIDFMVGGVNRMHALINDLLAYSRVQSRGGQFRPVDLGAAAEAAILNLSEAIQSVGGTVCVGAMPVVVGDHMQLVGVFQNLIGNGVKFARPGVPPRVTLTAEPSQDGWTVSVADNGIGIAAEHHERVFDLFQRLHSQAEYPGTGIGLSVCKRIIEHHGGSIGLESRPGQGTVFRFTLPARGEDREDAGGAAVIPYLRPVP